VSVDFHYGTETVDIAARDLPGLKARYVVDHVPEGAVVLEIGCGGGKMLRTVAAHRRPAALLGCDVAKPDPLPEDFEFTLVEPDGRLPYDDATVDVVLVVDVLEHVDDPPGLLGEVHRVLRRDGRLVAFVPVEGEPVGWYALFRRLFGRDLYARTKGHVQAFRHRDLDALLSSRFQIDDRRYAYHAVGALMDAAFCASLSIERVRTLFWRETPYYNASDGPRPLPVRVFVGVLRAANAVVWAESRLLSRVRTGSAGVLLAARRR
jgi:SAM-dependent methyltransferase